jgi:aspartate aminotransferase
MVTLSKRGASAPASPIRKLVPYADKARARGIKVHHLNIGQPDVETPAVMREALAQYSEKVIAYAPSGGTHSFRSFLTKYYARYDIQLRPEDLLVTTGGSEALIFAFAACLDPGDDILIPDPMYANYLGFASLLGNRVVPIPTSVEQGYHLPDDLDGFVTDRTRAVLLCNPANPTGAVYSQDEIQRVIDLVIKHDIFLIADEVYREFVYDGPAPHSMLARSDIEDRVIVVDSLSKRFSLCGGRIGCLVTRNHDVSATALKFAQARLSPPSLAQIVGERAGALGADYFDSIRAEYRRRRDVVYEALASIPGCMVHRPEGAFYQMARLPVSDTEDFVRFMLEDFHVDGCTMMVAPGAGFYAAEGRGQDEVRIAYVLNEDDLRTSMEILKAGLVHYRALGRA